MKHRNYLGRSEPKAPPHTRRSHNTTPSSLLFDLKLHRALHGILRVVDIDVLDDDVALADFDGFGKGWGAAAGPVIALEGLEFVAEKRGDLVFAGLQ